MDEEELFLRTRRKKFYLRNGFTMLPYDIDLWGTEMEMLSNGMPCSYEEYLDIYTTAFGKRSRTGSTFAGGSGGGGNLITDRAELIRMGPRDQGYCRFGKKRYGKFTKKYTVVCYSWHK